MEEEKQKYQFFKYEIDNVLNKIYSGLKQEIVFDNDQILYFPEKYPVSETEFDHVFDYLTIPAADKDLFLRDEECIFPNKTYFIKWKDLKVVGIILWGQGTAIILRLAREDEWSEKHSITLEECHSYWQKQILEYEKEHGL